VRGLLEDVVGFSGNSRELGFNPREDADVYSAGITTRSNAMRDVAAFELLRPLSKLIMDGCKA